MVPVITPSVFVRDRDGIALGYRMPPAYRVLLEIMDVLLEQRTYSPAIVPLRMRWWCDAIAAPVQGAPLLEGLRELYVQQPALQEICSDFANAFADILLTPVAERAGRADFATIAQYFSLSLSLGLSPPVDQEASEAAWQVYWQQWWRRWHGAHPLAAPPPDNHPLPLHGRMARAAPKWLRTLHAVNRIHAKALQRHGIGHPQAQQSWRALLRIGYGV